MSQLAKFPLKNGGFLAVEVDAVDSPGSRVMEVAVEFGVKMSAETGAIIAKASGEANFKINLMWKKAPAGK